MAAGPVLAFASALTTLGVTIGSIVGVLETLALFVMINPIVLAILGVGAAVGVIGYAFHKHADKTRQKLEGIQEALEKIPAEKQIELGLAGFEVTKDSLDSLREKVDRIPDVSEIRVRIAEIKTGQLDQVGEKLVEIQKFLDRIPEDKSVEFGLEGFDVTIDNLAILEKRIADIPDVKEIQVKLAEMPEAPVTRAARAMGMGMMFPVMERPDLPPKVEGVVPGPPGPERIQVEAARAAARAVVVAPVPLGPPAPEIGPEGLERSRERAVAARLRSEEKYAAQLIEISFLYGKVTKDWSSKTREWLDQQLAVYKMDYGEFASMLERKSGALREMEAFQEMVTGKEIDITEEWLEKSIGSYEFSKDNYMGMLKAKEAGDLEYYTFVSDLLNNKLLAEHAETFQKIGGLYKEVAGEEVAVTAGWLNAQREAYEMSSSEYVKMLEERATALDQIEHLEFEVSGRRRNLSWEDLQDVLNIYGMELSGYKAMLEGKKRALEEWREWEETERQFQQEQDAALTEQERLRLIHTVQINEALLSSHQGLMEGMARASERFFRDDLENAKQWGAAYEMIARSASAAMIRGVGDVLSAKAGLWIAEGTAKLAEALGFVPFGAGASATKYFAAAALAGVGAGVAYGAAGAIRGAGEEHYGGAFGGGAGAEAGGAEGGRREYGAAVRATPTTIYIQPSVTISGDTIIIGRTGVDELKETMGAAVVESVRDSLETGEIDLRQY